MIEDLLQKYIEVADYDQVSTFAMWLGLRANEEENLVHFNLIESLNPHSNYQNLNERKKPLFVIRICSLALKLFQRLLTNRSLLISTS